jgi:hypothetical protein
MSLRLYQGHLRAPLLGGDVQQPANVEVDQVGLRQRLVQGALADLVAQRGLRDLVDRGVQFSITTTDFVASMTLK